MSDPWGEERMTTERYGSAKVMLQVYRRLCEGEVLTTQDIVQDYGVGRRSASFYMDVITEAADHVIDSRRGKERCLQLAEPMALVSVTRKLGIILALGRHFLTPFRGTDFAEHYNNMMADLEEAADPESRVAMLRWLRKLMVRHPGDRRHAERQAELDAILKALDEERKLAFTYRSFDGRRSRRVVEPLTMVVWNEELYLVAYEAQTRKTFALYSMEEVEVQPDKYVYPSFQDYDPERVFENSIGMWASEEAPIELLLRFSGRWETYFTRTRLHHSQKVQLDPEGRVEVRWRIVWTPEVRQFILRFGFEAEVLSPPQVRQDIRDTIQKLASLYGDGAKPR